MEISFERQDVNFAVDVYKGIHPHLPRQSKFACIFDQTYGSLHLTSRLMEWGLLKKIFQRAIEIASNDPADIEVNDETLQAIMLIRKELSHKDQFVVVKTETAVTMDNCIRVILPGSVGLASAKDYRPYLVESIFFSPREQTLCYRGKYKDSSDKITSIIFPVERIVPSEDSKWGFYDLETGELRVFNAKVNSDETIDYKLTDRFAKKLTMTSKSEKGEMARDYIVNVSIKIFATRNHLHQKTNINQKQSKQLLQLF